ncbi:MFS transporter [Nocardioides insulae]|uniref:MFS transporter n=1 Tax=Nocardioides insulae TaxID=394734 RepID=UPI00040BC6E7|nr:MFS transporter [Nocardioides insulae]
MTQPGTRSNPLVAVVVLCLGGLAVSLTQTLVIPIQPDLPELLDTSVSNASWVITATLLGGAIAMPVLGRLSDMVGKRRGVLTGAVLMVIGSLICSVASSLVPMLVGRTFQGMAMGFIPVAISLMREITPRHLSGTAMSAMSATLGVGGAIGLPFGAWAVGLGDWHVMFWVATALSLVILVAIAVVVPHVDDARGGRFDVPGAIGLALGLSCFLIGVSKSPSWGWTDSRTLGAVLGGVAILLVWGAFELRRAEPLVDLRTTARLPILMCNLAAVMVGFGLMAQMIVMPQLLQLPAETGYGLGQSTLAAGLWLAPSGLMMMFFAPVSSRMIAGAGARVTLMVGATVLGCGYLVAVFAMHEPWQLLIAACIGCAGVGIGYAAMPTLILDTAPVAEAASAVGVNGLSRSLGTTSASAVMVTVLAGHTVPLGGLEVPSEGSFTACFLIGGAAAFLAAFLAAAVPRGLRSAPIRIGADDERPAPSPGRASGGGGA